MKKNYWFKIMAAFVVVIALAAMTFLFCHTDTQVLATEVQDLRQLQDAATAEVKLLKTVLNYLQQWLPTL